MNRINKTFINKKNIKKEKKFKIDRKSVSSPYLGINHTYKRIEELIDKSKFNIKFYHSDEVLLNKIANCLKFNFANMQKSNSDFNLKSSIIELFNESAVCSESILFAIFLTSSLDNVTCPKTILLRSKIFKKLCSFIIILLCKFFLDLFFLSFFFDYLFICILYPLTLIWFRRSY